MDATTGLAPVSGVRQPRFGNSKMHEAPTSLSATVAVQLAQWIASEGMSVGDRLVERRIAERLRVSRSPVRAALRLLEEEGVVQKEEGGGYVVKAERPITPAKLDAAKRDEEQLYSMIAEDRMSGDLDERVTENELMRRYNVSRSELSHVLRRAAGEGWIERLPGHGWAFLPVLNSMDTYRDSFRFRLVIEPAAILEDTFVLDRESIEACRDQQMKLVEGEIWSISARELFNINSAFHEAVMACSRNVFFIDSLQRINRLRRLIEYRRAVNRQRALELCREHIQLADLLLRGDREAASFYMSRHLSDVRRAKMNEVVDSGHQLPTAIDLETIQNDT